MRGREVMRGREGQITPRAYTKKQWGTQIRPPRDAPLSWCTTFALKKMKQHGAIYLNPFSHRLSEDIDKHELQRLRCRVNYHALRFKPNIMKISSEIVNRLRSQEQKILIKYRKENFAEKELVYRERRLIGKCPLTPEEDMRFIPRLGTSDIGSVYLAELKCSGIGAGVMATKVMDKKELEGRTK